MTKRPPLVVIAGGGEALGPEEERLRDAGWNLETGWQPAGPGPEAGRADGVVLVGVVATEADAGAAVLAAARGAGVLAAARPGTQLLARLYDDLRRIGPTELQPREGDRGPRLDREQRRLLDLLSEGSTLGAAAAELNYSRRTLNRRLAAVRAELGVRTTAEALVFYSRQKLE